MIVVNGRFLTQNITGVNRFAIEICKQLKALGVEFKIVVPYWFNGPDFGLDIIRYGKLRSHFWEQVDLLRFLRAHNSPLLVSFSGLGPVLYTNQIFTIHDLSFLVNPKWFSKPYYLLYATLTPILARKARLIITVSEFSKCEIVKLLNIRSSKIVVVPNAVDHIPTCITSRSNAQEFILAVSSLDPRKNLIRLVQAYRALNRPDIKLVLVGMAQSHFNFKIEDDSFGSSVCFTGYVSDERLHELYSTAKFFIYPSLYEGFGIPPLEAMKSGAAVICSDIPSLREVCGDAAYYIDPYCVKSLSDGLNVLLNDNILRDRLIEYGGKQVQTYSWRTSAERLITSINKVLKDD